MVIPDAHKTFLLNKSISDQSKISLDYKPCLVMKSYVGGINETPSLPNRIDNGGGDRSV